MDTLNKLIQFQQQIITETSAWSIHKKVIVGSFIIFASCYILLRMLICDKIKTNNIIIEESNMWLKSKLLGTKYEEMK